MEIGIPGNVLVDILAGKTSLMKEFRLTEADAMIKALNDRWVIEDCSLKHGNLQSGQAPVVILKLSPVPGAYWLEPEDSKQVG
jgi:hypothetical protein